MTKLILHSIILKKDKYHTKEDALKEAHHMFPNEKSKKFIRETLESWRFRVKPKEQFDKTSFVTKVINKDISLVFGLEKK
jgi:hypothetical protein